MNMSFHSVSFENISIDLNPRYHKDFIPLFENFLAYIPLIRGTKRARFTQLMDLELFQSMAANMTKRSIDPGVLQDYFLGVFEEANFLEKRGKIQLAAAFYEFGAAIVDTVKDASIDTLVYGNYEGVKFLDPKMLGAFGIGTDLQLAHAIILHKLAETKKINQAFPTHSFEEIFDSKSRVDSIWKWPGLTTRQRIEAHKIQGLIIVQMAQYLSDPANVAYAKSHAGADLSPLEPHAFYVDAAHDFYYAAEMDPDPMTSEVSRKLWSQISSHLGETEALKPEIIIMDIPGYGVWKGSRQYWTTFQVPIEAFKYFHRTAFCTKSETDLTAMRGALCIKWREKPAGMLRLLAV